MRSCIKGVVGLTLALCSGFDCRAEDRRSSPAPLSPAFIAELRGAPTSLALQGLSLSLSVTLYRDFMMQPPGSEGGSHLIAIMVVSTSDDRPFPDDVSVNRAWIIHGEEVWEPARLVERDRSDPGFRHEHGGNVGQSPSACEVTAHNGPKWGPRVDVDVVVQLRDGGGQDYLLRKPGQRIVGLGG